MYYKWIAKRVGNEFTSPSKDINDASTTRVDPIFEHATDNAVWTYAIASAEIPNLENYIDWSVVLVSKKEVLSAAQDLNSDVYIVDEIIIFPLVRPAD